MIEDTIYTRLSTYAGLTAIVSTRIYPMMLPQDCVLPAICYFKVSEVSTHAMGQDCSVSTDRFQISCFATTYKGVKALKAQVKACLSRYRAGTIQDILYDGAIDLYDDEIKVHHIPVDFIVFNNI